MKECDVVTWVCAGYLLCSVVGTCVVLWYLRYYRF